MHAVSVDDMGKFEALIDCQAISIAAVDIETPRFMI